MIRTSRRALFLALAPCLAACDAPEPEGGDGIEDSFAHGKADGGLQDGDPTAIGVLRVVNELGFAQLDDEVGLNVRAVRAIFDVRRGPDGLNATSDDRSFTSLAELDAVPWVGPVALGLLVEYAIEHGFVPPTTDPECVAGYFVSEVQESQVPSSRVSVPAGRVDLRIELLATEPFLDEHHVPRITLTPENDPGAFGIDLTDTGVRNYGGLRIYVERTPTALRVDLVGTTKDPYRIAGTAQSFSTGEDLPFQLRVSDELGRRCQVLRQPQICEQGFRTIDTGPVWSSELLIPAGTRYARIEPAVVAPSSIVAVEIFDTEGNAVVPWQQLVPSSVPVGSKKHDGVIFVPYEARGDGWGYGVTIFGETQQDYVARLHVARPDTWSITDYPWLLASDETTRLCDQRMTSVTDVLTADELRAPGPSCNLDVDGDRVSPFACTLEEGLTRVLTMDESRKSFALLSTDIFGNSLQHFAGIYKLGDLVDFATQGIFVYSGHRPRGTTASLSGTVGTLWAPARLQLTIDTPETEPYCPSRPFVFVGLLPRPVDAFPELDPRWLTQPSDVRDLEIVERVGSSCE